MEADRGESLHIPERETDVKGDCPTVRSHSPTREQFSRGEENQGGLAQLHQSLERCTCGLLLVGKVNYLVEKDLSLGGGGRVSGTFVRRKGREGLRGLPGGSKGEDGPDFFAKH